jgi:hypothetical protein
MPAMLRHPMRRMLSIFRLGGSRPMMDHRLHRFAIVDLRVIQHGALAEIFAHVITRKNFRRYQPRADMSVLITQDELVKPGLADGPVFARRHQDRTTRCSRRSSKDEGMNAMAIDNLDIGQLAAAFFDYYCREGAACGEKDQKGKSEKFGTHKRLDTGRCSHFESDPPAFSLKFHKGRCPGNEE